MHTSFTLGIRRHINSTLERSQTCRVDYLTLDPLLDPVLARIPGQRESRLQIILQYLIVSIVGEVLRGDPSLDPRYIDEDLEIVVVGNACNQTVGRCR